MPRSDCPVPSCRIAAQDAAQLRQLAAAKGLTVSDLLREVIGEHLLSSPSR
jgi:hypothetical protein